MNLLHPFIDGLAGVVAGDVVLPIQLVQQRDEQGTALAVPGHPDQSIRVGVQVGRRWP